MKKCICHNILLALGAALLFACLGGCRTIGKELRIDSPVDAAESGLIRLEELIVALDNAADRTQGGLASARREAASLEKEAGRDADYAGRLSAWSGRLALLEGKPAEARRLLRESRTLSPGNLPATILAIRLEDNAEKRLELIESELALTGAFNASQSSGFGELQIEKAKTLAELRRFAEAAGAFDTAFAALQNVVYRTSYLEERNRAWELRNINGQGGNIDILRRADISWKDCITLTKNETQLLRFMTGGRDISEAELFSRLLDRSFIPFTQDISLNDWPAARPRIEEKVLRSGAAWYIWRLYAEARADRSLLTRYSARYASGGNPRSPIADIPALSPFLDSILGCVETEFLSLSDGKNFNGANTISAAEFLAALKKIRN